MGGLFRARLVTVDGTGYVVGCRITLRDMVTRRIAYDEAVDVELLERGIEVEFERTEIRNALRILHLDLLHLCFRQHLTAFERVTGDAVQEPCAVTVDGLVEGGAIDQRLQLCRQRHRGDDFADARVLSFAEDAIDARKVFLDDRTGRRVLQRRVERIPRLQVRLELVFGMSLVEVTLQRAVVLFDQEFRKLQHIGRPVHLVEDFDLRVREVGTERTALRHSVENRQRLFVIAAPGVKIGLKFSQGFGHTLRGVHGEFGFDFLPFLAICQQAGIQCELVVLSVPLAKQFFVNTHGLVRIVVLVGEPGVPAAHDEIVSVAREPWLQPFIGFLVGVDLDQHAERIHHEGRFVDIEIGRLGQEPKRIPIAAGLEIVRAQLVEEVGVCGFFLVRSATLEDRW